MTERFAYDEVPYDTEANTEAHPRSMATLARLFGRTAAPPSRARVLEIGCGDGEHM
ncbi:MAG: Regulatory domain of a methyltransferase-containing protein, partial [Labilithrix sp.]|nr:Regulatory domain of a methyltransferase-containing protein [Labilithrix sp.]